MTVTITITDPTATEASALRAYLTALHTTPEWVGKRIVMQADQVVFPAQHDPAAPSLEDTADRTREVMVELSEAQAVTASDAGAPDFDSAGYPWDERIHAGSRATVADGTWRKKRGVSPEEVASVEATLARGTETDAEVTQAVVDMGGAADPGEHDAAISVAAGLDAPEVPEAPVGEIARSATEPTVAEAAPTAPTDAPPPPPAATPNPFLAVMSRIGKSKLDKAKKDELLTAAGALDDKGNPSILVLNKRPELIDGFVALLDSEGV